MKVLTVDDSKTIRAVVAHYLTPLGMTVLQASDGAEGLEIMRGAKPDLAIVDVAMPNMDGLTMLSTKARDSAIAGIPVIMLTAGASQEFVLRCMKQGAKGFIVKPFEKKTLILKVCKILKIQPPAEDGGRTKVHGPTVMAVDQDEKDLSVLTEILLEGCELVTALDVRQALRQWRERRPESVWLDLGLPAAEVTEFVNTLRQEGHEDFVGLVPRGTPTPALAASLKIPTVLHKPFIRVEVREFASQHLGIFQRFLKRENEVCVLQIPGDSVVRVRDWVPALDGEVRIGLERESADGLRALVLDFSKITGAADVPLVSGVVKALALAASLNLQSVLAVGDEDTLRSFAGFADLKGARCSRSLVDAMEAVQRLLEKPEAAA